MDLRKVRIPRPEVQRFKTRAATFYPREIEDYMLGRHSRNGWDVSMILPTRLDDVAEHSNASVQLKEIAAKRAQDTASELGLRVLGSVHTHPYRAGCVGGGPMLSKTDYEGFPAMASWIDRPLQGVCAVYRVGKHPDQWQYWWGFWTQHSPLRVPFLYKR